VTPPPMLRHFHHSLCLSLVCGRPQRALGIYADSSKCCCCRRTSQTLPPIQSRSSKPPNQLEALPSPTIRPKLRVRLGAALCVSSAETTTTWTMCAASTIPMTTRRTGITSPRHPDLTRALWARRSVESPRLRLAMRPRHLRCDA
jgi:hypothetical protein